ncbi:MAG: cell cycle transcriptional regulator TrcR [Pseudomonadota bacterium]
MTQILMPKATAVWLIDNTAMSFKQISEFCGLHLLEVEGIADGDVGQGIRGADPIANGQVSREEIEKAEADPNYAMKPNTFDADELPKPKKRGPRYTPLSRRQDRPDAIAWLVRNHPEMSDAQISKLIGTTKPTINSIRERTHWKINTIQPQDPVSLGLTSQIELDKAVKIAAEKKAKEDAKNAVEGGETLKPAPQPEPEEETSKADLTLENLFKPSN